jgi:hypothetical protein
MSNIFVLCICGGIFAPPTVFYFPMVFQALKILTQELHASFSYPSLNTLLSIILLASQN